MHGSRHDDAPAGCSCKKVTPGIDLENVEADHNLQMESALCHGCVSALWVHLGTINTLIPLREGRAGWRPNDPIWLVGLDKSISLFPVGLVPEVPGLAIRLSRPEIEGAEAVDI